MEGVRKAMNERNLQEGQWEGRRQWGLGVGQRGGTFWNRPIYMCVFFQIQMYQIVPLLVKHVSNTSSAKTYHIDRLTHKNCKCHHSNSIAQLTDRWARILQSRDISSHRWSCKLRVYFLVLKHCINFTPYNWMKIEKSE
jgi:hypothetical protein